MNSLEIIALIFIVISLIKLVTISFSPKAWYSTTNPLVKMIWNKYFATVFSLFFGGLILFYLLAEISIVQVFVAVMFTFFLAILTVAPNIKKVIKTVANHLEEEKLFSKYWFPAFIWIGLMVWVLWEILYKKF